MKTDDLIAILSKDATLTMPVSAALVRWVPLGVAAAGLGFALFLGLRTGLGERAVMIAVGMKFLSALLLAGTASAVALRLASPGTSLRSMAPALLLAPAFLTAFVLFDLLSNGVSDIPGRILGMSALRCMIVIPLLAIFPLAAILAALRNGAASRPVVSGAVGGLTAAGIAAGLYAFNCADDSPLFVLVWYGLAAILLAGLGALAGRRILAW